MPTLEIDGQSVTVEDGLNVIQAAERLGIEVPHYCYHPALTIAGNCRMCLVEIEKAPKLQIACNTRCSDGMVRGSDGAREERPRRGAEFPLLNHAIDCPVCDQAGEQLQTTMMDYDRQRSRARWKTRSTKRRSTSAVDHARPERCILCTRWRLSRRSRRPKSPGVFERGTIVRSTSSRPPSDNRSGTSPTSVRSAR
jgi:NADH-quinone oxidoreductase subunit G